MLLSRVENLLVIGHASTAGFRGENRATDLVVRELGVRCLVDGNIRIIEERAHLNIHLIDTRTKDYVWGQGYEFEMNDSLAHQEIIIVDIAREIETFFSSR